MCAWTGSGAIVSYRIVSYRIVSYRIVSYRIVSYRINWWIYAYVPWSHHGEYRDYHSRLSLETIRPSPSKLARAVGTCVRWYGDEARGGRGMTAAVDESSATWRVMAVVARGERDRGRSRGSSGGGASPAPFRPAPRRLSTAHRSAPRPRVISCPSRPLTLVGLHWYSSA